EKRLVFLRSYQFSRKQSLCERIKKSFVGIKMGIKVRFRSAIRLRKKLWVKFVNGIFFTRRRGRDFRRLYAP
ncbi:hypothetical protein M569_11190, partial [Genlisea aurea]